MKIPIEKAWLERLVELKDKIRSTVEDEVQYSWVNHLLGYIESAKLILKDDAEV